MCKKKEISMFPNNKLQYIVFNDSEHYINTNYLDVGSPEPHVSPVERAEIRAVPLFPPV